MNCFNHLETNNVLYKVITFFSQNIELKSRSGLFRNLFLMAIFIFIVISKSAVSSNMLFSIPTEVTFTETEAKEHAEQQAFMQWLVQHLAISDAQFEDLSNFVESLSTQVSASALSIMVAHQLLDYREPYLVPDLTKSMEVKKPKAQTSEISNGTIRIYPNPGKDYITIEYAVDEINVSLDYEITDHSGKVVKKSNLGKSADQVIIDTRELASGSYYISLISGNKNVAGTRFVIAK